MNRRVNLTAAVNYIKWSCLPVCSWPLSLNSSRTAIFRRNVLRWCTFIALTIVEMGLLYAISRNTDDMDRMILIVTELCTCFLIQGKIMVCNEMSHDLQILFHRMDEFVKSASVEEMEVLQRIVERCSLAYGIPPLIAMIAVVAYVSAPAFTSQELPIAAEFPFSVTPTWIRCAIYPGEIFVILTCSCTGNMDTMCAILIWYVVARFQMLSARIRKSKGAEDMKDCIAAHVELLEYVDLLKPVAQRLCIITAYGTMVGLIGAGYMLLRRTSLYETMKFGFFEGVALVEIFIYCWPADNLIESSEEIGEAAATCQWIGKSSEMRKDIILMIQRSRMPVIIHSAGILPPLSLQFCASTLSSNFGYLTALRSLMNAEE